MNVCIIGIGGGSSSGKTTIAKKVYEATNKRGTVAMIKLDDYYKRHDELSFEERSKINYDHPNAYDVEYLISNLKKLKAGQEIIEPIYDFVNHNRSDKTEIIKPANVIIIEGILTLAIPELEAMCDIKLYVDTPDDIRFIRRLTRDTSERGRTIDSVVNQYLKTVRPMHISFVEPSKKKADLIIPEGGENKIAIDFIATRILDILKQENKL
ncbi:MAG: uridine kinase [Bacilli bacterium]|nr:uridine kinase [Bacilli bacterium]